VEEVHSLVSQNVSRIEQEISLCASLAWGLSFLECELPLQLVVAETFALIPRLSQASRITRGRKTPTHFCARHVVILGTEMLQSALFCLRFQRFELVGAADY
jgi:hypothetical protein